MLALSILAMLAALAAVLWALVRPREYGCACDADAALGERCRCKRLIQIDRRPKITREVRRRAHDARKRAPEGN